MVVILLLTPYTTNGCDGGTCENSGTSSTTSTGSTTISNEAYNEAQQRKHQLQQKNPIDSSQSNITSPPICTHQGTTVHCYTDRSYLQKKTFDSNDITYNKSNWPKNSQSSVDQKYFISASPSPPPPPLPKSKPPYELLYPSGRQIDSIYRVNAVPKPPRGKLLQPTTNQRIRIYPKDHSTSTAVIYDPVLPYQSQQQSNTRHTENKENICNTYSATQEQPRRPPSKITNIADIVRHVTRVNFYDIDTLQVEFEPKDDTNCDTEAITKEEEWITKRKTELTTTRQIETRVKRQVTLADGKVVEDSGPIVSTNTTEDTDKQETETTEKRDLGIPIDNPPNAAIKTQEHGGENDLLQQLQPVNANTVIKLIPRPEDGLVRETADKRIISHEVLNDYLETEDVRHLGDFSDETYINAIHNKGENLEEALLLATQQKDLAIALPKVIATTNKSYKTIDTEDSVKRCLAQPDGTIVTESKKTTEHEVIVDKDLADDEDKGSAGNYETTATHEARQRFFKQRDEQHVDLVADGKVISTEMRYAAETMQLEKDGSLERPGDWDSLSDRMRKLRKPQKSLLQQQKEAALLLDRKDALTKRPLDFDREEETRKGETMKWLESHFGSESTASNDSRDDTEIEPTKRTFFNVTIKSNHAINEAPQTGTKVVHDKDKRSNEGQVQIAGMGKSRYYQGISNWAERKNLSTHFATKAFQDDLRETVEKNRLKNSLLRKSGDKLYNGHQNVSSDYKDNYVSREDILQQKRQSISSQFLARSKRGSADLTGLKDTSDYNIGPHNEANFVLNDEHTKLHMKHDRDIKKDFSIHKGRSMEYDISRTRNSKSIDNLDNMPAPGYSFDIYKYQRDSKMPSTDMLGMQSKTLDRPKVPQRKRAVERRLRQQISAPSESTLAFEHHAEQVEPPPDYSPPPRSRSASPQIDYIQDLESKDVHFHATDPSNYAGNVVSARKLNQRTRFAPSSLTPQSTNQRPKMSTQTTQTTPSTISSSTPPSHKSNKMGQAIGNSIRKLVSKIRSASAERKFRMKSKSKSREQSPSLQETDKGLNNAHSTTTYQQYNVIDSHIGGGGQSTGYESGQDCVKEQIISNAGHNLSHLETSGVSKNDTMKMLKRSEASDLYVSQRDLDAMANPRQRYYLGEDPYSSTLCGKENVYNPSSVIKQHHDLDAGYLQRKNRENDEKYVEQPKNLNRYMSTNTLGRYQKTSQRLAGSTPNLTSNNRIAKTLPRKLVEHTKAAPQDHYQASKLDGRARQQVTIPVNTGPIKPARTYTNSLSRSKSFNLHGLNGTAEQSPIYIEKLSGKQKNYQNSHVSYGYKRDPNPKDLNSMLQSGLKSPSIVNLISRSQKDLTKIESVEDEVEFGKYNDRDKSKTLQREANEKKIIFLRGSHQQAPDLYKTHHADEELKHERIHKYPLKTVHSLDSRSPIQINKDTASIVRVDAHGPEHHATTMTRREKYNLYMDDKRRGSGSTIIAVNRK